MNARYVIGNDSAIDATDRGLAYGDGLFETMSVRRGRVERLPLHLERLDRGCDRLRFPTLETRILRERIAEAATGIDRGHLKLILTRGSGPRGYRPPESPTPTVILLAEALAAEPPPEIDATVLTQRLGENPNLAGIKHLNRLEQVLGQLELSESGADEGIMLSTSGLVISGTTRNLFAVIDGVVTTPAVDRAGIAGVMRASVLTTCRDIGIEATERDLLPEELARAAEIFMTNAVVGIQSVCRVDDRPLASDRIAGRLRPSLAAAAAPEATDA